MQDIARKTANSANFRLLRYFSITSFLATAIAAVLMFFFFEELETKNLLELGQRQNVALTRAFANSLWATLSGFVRETNKPDFKSLPGHPVISVINFTIKHLIKDLQVVKIKIYNKNGQTIFSTQLEQIGEDQSQNEGIKAAMQGEISSNLIHRDTLSSFDKQIENRDLISSYVPLTRGEGQEVEGVFELYYDVTPIFQRMSITRTQVVLGVVLLFLSLYGVLYVIVRRADRIILEQNEQLQKYVYEIGVINESLEERVSERTERLSAANRALEDQIAERLRTEVELKKLSRAVEQSPSSVMITDCDGRIEYVNPKFLRLTGYELEELLGQNPSILKSGSMKPQDYEEMWKTISSGQEWRGEFLNRKKTGELFWEAASISPIRNTQNEITHYIAVKEDITERKLAIESLRHSEMRLRTIMDNVVEGIIMVNQEGIIEAVNSAVEMMFHYESRELLGQNVRILVPEVHKERHDEYIRGFLHWHDLHLDQLHPFSMRGELFFERQIEVQRRNGEKFPMELTISHVATDNKVQFIATLKDISERKKAEKELEEARRNSFQQEKMAAIGTLAAGIVHEIGNPIAAISGLVEVLQNQCGRMDEENRALLEMIAEYIQRLADIKRDVSEFSMPQSDSFQWLNLNGLITLTMRVMRFDKRMRNIATVLHLDHELPAIIGSGSQLRQVLLNLLINAADALEGVEDRKKEVTIMTEVVEDKAVLMIADNGIGMEPQVLERAFEAFWTSKPVGKGTGLGLSICYSIISEHKGTIDLFSVKGEGTQVRIQLPLAKE